MAELIYTKPRIAKIEMADPILSEAALAAMIAGDWSLLPLTLRDDEVSIVDEDPEESEVFSHENDTAEDYDIIGKGSTIVGSFIKATRDQLIELMGGTKVGTDASTRIHRSSQRLLLNVALKFTLKDGGEFIVPNAKGYVSLNASVGYGGMTKYPFRFKVLKAASDWDVDIIW